jgi:hypothetical protein
MARSLCVSKQVRELAALEFKHLFGQPILSFYQHFINALAKWRGIDHGIESKQQNLALANDLN